MNNGILGESRAITELIKQGYEIFTQFSGKAPFDFVAYLDGECKRVEVKSTSRRTKYDTGWEVQLKKVRPNSSRNVITNFDNTSCDILCVYIVPLDIVVVYNSSDIKAKTSMAIQDGEVPKWS